MSQDVPRSIKRRDAGQPCPGVWVAAAYLLIAAAVAGAYGNPQNDPDYGAAVAVDSREGIVVVGGLHDDGAAGASAAIWRFNPDGTPDTGFNSTGRVQTGGIGSASLRVGASGATLDSDGRIVVVGSSADSLVVLRFNADGTLDTTFGSGGYLTQYLPAAEYGSQGRAVCLDADGRIVVAGQIWNGSNHDIATWRFNPNGGLDTTFAGTGYVVADSSGDGWGRDFAEDIALDPDERILVVGRVATGTESAMRVWRYLADGTADSNFGSGGHATVENASGTGIVIDPRGTIHVAGHVVDDFQYRMAVWRFSDHGELDMSFNSSGFVVDDTAGSSFGNDVGLDPGGMIVVVGTSSVEESVGGMTVWRYAADGALDMTFGDAGRARYGISTVSRGAYGSDLVIDSDGRLLVTGGGLKSDPYEDNWDMATLRLNPDGTLDQSFNGTGYLVRD